LPKSDAILDRLLSLHPKRIDLSLGRIERLLAALGSPERKLPPTVHVAGTNGKGSLIAFLRAGLEAEGRRVHVYTSPHLVAFAERIRLAGQLIDDDALAALLDECELANAGAPITFFEITTAAAMLAFARSPADVLLLETGLGGRLDATNVLATPRLTAITPIGLDHQQFLGDSLAGIAAEKAAITRPGVPCVVAQQQPEAWDAIAKRDAPLLLQGRDWSVESDADGMTFRSGEGELRLPLPPLAGPHQIANAGQALACLELLGIAEPVLDAAKWPGRLQRLESGALVEQLPPGCELWLDGGHNADAAAALAAHVKESWRDRPLALVVGMLDSKSPEAFLGSLAGLADHAVALAIPGQSASLSPNEIPGCEAADSLAAALASCPANARILVCGSLYLVGYALAENGTPPD